jgi:hypothetical protein
MELFTSYTVGMAEAFAKYRGKDGRFPELLGMHIAAMRMCITIHLLAEC